MWDYSYSRRAYVNLLTVIQSSDRAEQQVYSGGVLLYMCYWKGEDNWLTVSCEENLWVHYCRCSNKNRECTFKGIRYVNIWSFHLHSSSTVCGYYQWPQLPEQGQLGCGISPIKELLCVMCVCVPAACVCLCECTCKVEKEEQILTGARENKHNNPNPPHSCLICCFTTKH